eukprot:scaffold546_cov352-Prasinococcus_capsulatus_cf.AAC.10
MVSGMLPTPKASSTMPRTPRPYKSPYAWLGSHLPRHGSGSALVGRKRHAHRARIRREPQRALQAASPL